MSYKTAIDNLVNSSKTIAKMPNSLRERLQPTPESLQKLGAKYGFEYYEKCENDKTVEGPVIEEK